MILRKTCFGILTLHLICFHSFAQKHYAASAGETIFSLGMVRSDSSDLTPVVRFSPVFNIQEQVHFDFSSSMGIYTGLGVRNVGLISHWTDAQNNTVKIKERAYSLGVPLALKFGNLDNGFHFALGGEAEMMFAYKRKVKVDGHDKMKTSGWFDENVNIFNPSVFAELKFPKGQYIRVKYYLLDFLDYHGLYQGNVAIPDYGPESPLLYVSLGTVKIIKPKIKKTEPSKGTSAFFHSRASKSNSFAEEACSSTR